MKTLELPYYIDGELKENRTVTAEGIHGLYVHKSATPEDDGWRVSNVAGIRMYPHTIPTRERARKVARALASLVPTQVLSGAWNGERWAREDRTAADDYRAAVDALSGFKHRWCADD